MSTLNRIKQTYAELRKIWAPQAQRQNGVTREDIIRAVSNVVRSHYDAASTNRLREDWPFTSAVPYTDIMQSLPKLIARSRREIDNNGIAKGIRNTLSNNIWGDGPVVQSQIRFKESGEQIKGLNDEIEYAWARHCDELDASGQSNFNIWGKEALDTIISSGTVLINRAPSEKTDYLKLCYQMYEPDILDTSKDDQKIYQDMNKPADQVLHGIAVNKKYRPVKYYIKGIKNPIPAEYMRHFYIRYRPTQVIGVPWLHASLPDLFDYRQLKEDQLVKSRILADIVMWNPNDAGLWGDAAKNDDGNIPWEPGEIIKSKNKPEIIQADGDLNATLKPLVDRVLHDACAGAMTSYMAVSRDMDGINFAASRTNLNEDRAGYKVIRNWMVFTFCQYIWNNFVYQCVLEGKISLSLDQFLKDPYRYTRASFLFPAWDWVDPRADSDAMINTYSAGLNNLKEACGKRAMDWRDHVDQRLDEYTYIKDVAKEKGVPEEEALKIFIGDNKNVQKTAETTDKQDGSDGAKKRTEN